MQSSEIHLVNFRMLFDEGYENDPEYPGDILKNKRFCRLNLKTLENYAPFATIFSKRGWSSYEDIFIKEFPKEYKVIFKSECCTNSTHPGDGRCQYIVVVDKNDKDCS